MTFRATVLAVLLLSAAMTSGQEAGADAQPGRTSLRTLIEATRIATGSDIVYSDTLVGTDLLVPAGLAGSDPVGRLRAALTAHGLVLKGDHGTWYVVRDDEAPQAGRGATLVVFVRDERDRRRIVNANLELGGNDLEPLAEGAFRARGLAAGHYEVAASANGYETARQTVQLDTDEVRSLTLTLPATRQAILDTMVVSTSRYALLERPAFTRTTLHSEDISSLPALGEDPLRAMRRLPGTASGGVSAEVHIRGGLRNETLLILDGMELVDPFHLRDYQSLFSAIDGRILASVDVYTGGFPASFGDALSGVIAMNSLEPVDLSHEVSLSFFNASALSSGTFADGSGEWLVSARRGNLDLFIDQIDPSFGDPQYHDVFGRAGVRFGDTANLSVNVFSASDDVLVVTEAIPEERVAARSDTENTHAWLALEAMHGTGLESRTLLAWNELRNHRTGESNDAEAVLGDVDDRRRMRGVALKQDWFWRAGTHRETDWGWRWARVAARYDYRSSVQFFDLAADIAGRSDPLSRMTELDIDGEEFSAYVTHRFAPASAWLVETGLRWDKQTYTAGREQWSPRLSVLYRLTEHSDLRASVGRFYQSQRIHELQVEDGVESFFPAQLADHAIVGYERRFASGARLRVEAYQKRIRRMRPRFENLFDPLAILPELEPDRQRVAPDRGLVRGVEVYLDRRLNEGLSWWASYALSRAIDRVDGRSVPRNWDQRHALNAGLSWRTDSLEASLALAWRSGWPTTLATPALDEDGEVTAALGERNAARLDAFMTLDARVARHFELGDNRLTVFLDVINLLDRRNPCCVEYDLEGDGPAEDLVRETDNWLPRMPSLGFRWQF